jgi:hypothetical protein
MDFPDTPFQYFLEVNGACRDARAWVGSRTPEQAWEECDRGNWMAWLLMETSLMSFAELHWKEYLDEATQAWVKHLAEAWETSVATEGKTPIPLQVREEYAEALRKLRKAYADRFRKLVPAEVVAQVVAKKIALGSGVGYSCVHVVARPDADLVAQLLRFGLR